MKPTYNVVKIDAMEIQNEPVRSVLPLLVV